MRFQETILIAFCTVYMINGSGMPAASLRREELPGKMTLSGGKMMGESQSTTQKNTHFWDNAAASL